MNKCKYKPKCLFSYEDGICDKPSFYPLCNIYIENEKEVVIVDKKYSLEDKINGRM